MFLVFRNRILISNIIKQKLGVSKSQEQLISLKLFFKFIWYILLICYGGADSYNLLIEHIHMVKIQEYILNKTGMQFISECVNDEHDHIK